ncbi:lysine exporter LysO family protein [Patescibacteria group bacterium]
MKDLINLILAFSVGLNMAFLFPQISFFEEYNLFMIILYFLIFFCGLSMSGSITLKELKNCLKLKRLMIPVLAIIGSVGGSFILAITFLNEINIMDAIIINLGLGFYSFSSIFIGQHMGLSMGVLALLTNVFRELIVMIGSPVIARYFGSTALISSAGATASDSALPFIRRYLDKTELIDAVASGLVLTIAVPFILQLMVMAF